AQITPMRKVAGRLKLELSQYRELEAFSQFGSELDQATQRTLARGERLVSTLNQRERDPMPIEDQVVQVYAATNGYVDRIVSSKVRIRTARSGARRRTVAPTSGRRSSPPDGERFRRNRLPPPGPSV